MEDHFSVARTVRSIVEAVTGNTSPCLEEWDRIRTVIMKALAPFDEARQVVHDALMGIGRIPEAIPS
jgi:hypothetical protein